MTNSTQQGLVFRIDERLLQRRPPRLLLAATLSALCKQIKSADLDANFVVEILDENRLLPYMIGHNKGPLDTSLGRNTNASKIGDIIVSEECIRGTYELCISFIEFVLATIRNPKYKDTTRTMLASVTYILNEIYTSHHIWTYKDITDMDRILCICTEIFHHIVAHVKEPIEGSVNYKDLEMVCIIGLSQHHAHRQLLDVLVAGKSSIKKKMDQLELTSETSLLETPIVLSVRQSLLIFNKLLAHSKFIKDFCDTDTSGKFNSSPNYQHGASSSSAPMTEIERALFDTTIRPGLLQHLFSYIYQKGDSPTACLAVDLIKNIAKRFSMSLMACLGSEADKVCEFFVECLGNKESNVDLEVAILDLLSTCVKHQPGLIELFLNFKSESDSSVPKGSLGSLRVVMELLKECKDRQDEASYKLLHTYVMKFILTFWQKHHSAIEQFDKADKFWESLTHPLVKFLDTSDTAQEASGGVEKSPLRLTPSKQKQMIAVKAQKVLDEKLNSYALMILAREIFCLNSGISERKINPDLSKSLDELSKRNFLGKYSSDIRKKYLQIATNLHRGEDYNRLLSAWRDFLISFATYKPFEMSGLVQNQIVEDLLACMAVELRLGEKLDKERIAATGETLLLIWTKWMTKDSASGEIVFKSIHELLYLVDSTREYLPFSFLLTFQSTMNIYLAKHREELIKGKRSFDLLVPALQLAHFSLKIMEQFLNEQAKQSEFNYKPGVESRLCLASLMTLRFIADISRPDVSLWIQYMQTNLKTDSLVQFLTFLMNKRAGAEICLAVVELLLCLSSIHETADYLNKAGFFNQINMIAVSAYEQPYAHLSQLASINPINRRKTKVEGHQQDMLSPARQVEVSNSAAIGVGSVQPMSDAAKIYLDNMNSDHQWLPIYWHVIRLNISMLLTLSSDYMATAVEFLSIHCIRICELLELLRTKPRFVNMEEALQVIYMINLVLRHGCMWKKKNKQSYDAISDEIAKTAYTLATSALPPPTTGQPGDSSQQRTSIKPRDCLVYARCCYDFGKYTEAERVLFQTKFGDKNGFIKEAAQIYGDDLSVYAFHLAALICLKTNRQPDSLDFGLQVFAGDTEYLDIVNALAQNRA